MGASYRLPQTVPTLCLHELSVLQDIKELFMRLTSQHYRKGSKEVPQHHK